MVAGTHCKLVCVLFLVSVCSSLWISSAFRLKSNESETQVPLVSSGTILPAGVIVAGPGGGGDLTSSVQMTLRTLLSQAVKNPRAPLQAPTASTGSQIQDAIEKVVEKATAEQMITLNKELKKEAHDVWESLIPDLKQRIDDAIFKNNAEQRSRLGKSVATLTKDIGDAVSSHMKAFTEDLMVDDMPREDAPIEPDEEQGEVPQGAGQEQQEASDGTGEDASIESDEQDEGPQGAGQEQQLQLGHVKVL